MRCRMGRLGEDSSVGESQAELEDRLAAMHEDFLRERYPLGVLWVTVDQAHALRRTHGARACEAMLEKVERTLADGLKPAEEIGRWGDDEFLVLSHERNAADAGGSRADAGGAGAHRGFPLVGRSRIADREHWRCAGGAAARRCARLLERAQAAMLASMHAGGNHITAAQGRRACSPS